MISYKSKDFFWGGGTKGPCVFLLSCPARKENIWPFSCFLHFLAKTRKCVFGRAKSPLFSFLATQLWRKTQDPFPSCLPCLLLQGDALEGGAKRSLLNHENKGQRQHNGMMKHFFNRWKTHSENLCVWVAYIAIPATQQPIKSQYFPTEYRQGRAELKLQLFSLIHNSPELYFQAPWLRIKVQGPLWAVWSSGGKYLGSKHGLRRGWESPEVRK